MKFYFWYFLSKHVVHCPCATAAAFQCEMQCAEYIPCTRDRTLDGSARLKYQYNYQSLHGITKQIIMKLWLNLLRAS